MKVAISANSKDLEGMVDLRFGRASGFIIYNITDDTFKFIDNIQNLEASQGAGIQAAQNVVNEDIEALITGHCGPKAFKVLTSADIKIYVGAERSIKEALEKFKNNELQQIQSADVKGHWM